MSIFFSLFNCLSTIRRRYFLFFMITRFSSSNLNESIAVCVSYLLYKFASLQYCETICLHRAMILNVQDPFSFRRKRVYLEWEWTLTKKGYMVTSKCWMDDWGSSKSLTKTFSYLFSYLEKSFIINLEYKIVNFAI